jgi:hypothetical protein
MTIQLTTAARVLATLRARNAVKDQIRRQGLKVHQYKAREITGWANVYLDEHPELIPATLQDARAMILEGRLGKRAQRALAETDSVRKVTRNRTLAEPQAASTRTIHQCQTRHQLSQIEHCHAASPTRPTGNANT